MIHKILQTLWNLTATQVAPFVYAFPLREWSGGYVNHVEIQRGRCRLWFKDALGSYNVEYSCSLHEFIEMFKGAERGKFV